MTGPLALLVLILVAIAWLTAAATAVRTVSRIWLRHWVEQRLRGSGVVAEYLEHPQRLLVAASAANAALVFVAGAFVTARYGRPVGRLALALVLYAVVVLLLGQLLPRALARRFGPALLPMLVLPLRAVRVLLAPAIGLGRLLARPFTARSGGLPPAPPHEGIEDLLREGELEGVGRHDEIAIITGVVHFGEKRARDVMTPRAQIFALPEGTPPNELARSFAETGYSRVPIYRGSLDQVVGLVHVFDVLKAGGVAMPPVRPVAETPADRPCNELLFDMLRRLRHLAIVRDAHGTCVGLVTLEDLLEELVGDIRDEYDEPQPATAAPAPQAIPPSAP